MAKLSLGNITSGYLPVATINANSDAIEAAMENTLSRDGTSPNTMLADLDMNSHSVVNLPAPVNANDAARLADIESAVLGGFVNIAVSGTLTAAVSVITPLIGTNFGDFILKAGGTNRWRVTGTGGHFLPIVSGLTVGSDTNPVSQVFASVSLETPQANVKGTASLQGSINLSAASGAVGGFKRTLFTFRDDVGTGGWNITNVGDGGNVLNFDSIIAGVAATKFTFSQAGAFSANTSVVAPLVTTSIVDSGSGTLILKGAGTTAATITAAAIAFSGAVTATTFTGALSGNASTAAALQTARTINGISFDGTANITVPAAAGTLTGATLASGVTASSLTSAGTSFVWGTGTANFGKVIKRKTADESVNTTTTLQDDDHLLSAIAANEEWNGFVEYIFGSGMATTGVKVGMTFPAGSTLRYWATAIGDSAGASLSSTTTASGTALNFPAALFPTGTNAVVRICFWVLNGATPGNITAQFTQSTSNATNTTAFKGSFMQATRVA